MPGCWTHQGATRIATRDTLRVGGAIQAAYGVCLLVLLAAGCVNIDEEPGFAAELQRADVRVTSAAEGEVIAVSIEMRVRVGEYAQQGRDFDIPRADLYVDGRVVATANVESIAGGDMDLLPGESYDLVLQAQTRPGSFEGAGAQICAADTVGVEVQYVVMMRGGMDPLGIPVSEMGILSVDAEEVTCD